MIPQNAAMELSPRLTANASVTATSGGWRLTIPAGPRGTYRLAQLDDYTHLPRRAFRWRPPLMFSLRARVSAANLPGTWGFGLWNNPFGFSLGLGGTAGRLPALPNAAWFFHASPENHLSLRGAQRRSNPLAGQEIASSGGLDTQRTLLDHPPRNDPSTGSGQAPPANGFFAGTFRSPRWPPLLLAPGLLALPLLALRPVSRLLRRLAGRIMRQEVALIAVDVTGWHDYSLEWLCEICTFKVDGKAILQTPISPLPPLGLVIWIDNQYAAWRPDGSLGYGTLENPEAWMEIENLVLNQ